MKLKILKYYLFVSLFYPVYLFAQDSDTTYLNWVENKNEKEGYSLKLPSGFMQIDIEVFGFPKNLSWATGFHTEYIKIESGENVCENNIIKEFSEFKWDDTLNLNGRNYLVGTGGDGTAGTIYYSTYFITRYNGICFSLIYSRGHSISGYLGDDDIENKKFIDNIEKNDKETLEIVKMILNTLIFKNE